MADNYAWAGGREAVLRLGPAAGAAAAPLVLIAPALFEEVNRTRAFSVAIMRGLAARGVASALPDLPGSNDSLAPTELARLRDWRAAFAACASERPAVGFAIRGGALLDGQADLIARCHFAPVDGAALVRDMRRARLVSARDGGEDIEEAASGQAVELAGNLLSPEMIAELEAAAPGRANRVLRLDSDRLPCDRAFAGRALWRSSEPAVDADLAEALADDLAIWARLCAG